MNTNYCGHSIYGSDEVNNSELNKECEVLGLSLRVKGSYSYKNKNYDIKSIQFINVPDKALKVFVASEDIFIENIEPLIEQELDISISTESDYCVTGFIS